MAIRKLRRLVQLDVGSNQIASLPQWVTELAALQVLGLRSLSRRFARAAAANPEEGGGGEGGGLLGPGATDVWSIPDLSSLGLVELDLSDCDLFDCHLPPWLFDLETLQILDLSDNHLNHLPLRCGQLPRLERLSLANQGPWEGEMPLIGCEGPAEMFNVQGVR